MREPDVVISDTEKAAALDNLAATFCEEYWDFQGDGWFVIDGSAQLSPDAARVLESLFIEARRRADPEWPGPRGERVKYPQQDQQA